MCSNCLQLFSLYQTDIKKLDSVGPIGNYLHKFFANIHDHQSLKILAKLTMLRADNEEKSEM
jgi:hypothetical protein